MKKVKFRLSKANDPSILGPAIWSTNQGQPRKMQNLWDACLRRLEQELPAQQFNTWIRPLAPDAAAGEDTLVLTAPNRFVLELVRERFAARIERLAAETSGRECGLRLVLARGAESAARLPVPAHRGTAE